MLIIVKIFILLCLYSTAAVASGTSYNDTDNKAITSGTNPNFSVNVGIGSATPGQSLDVQGTVRALFFLGNGSAITNVPDAQWTTTNINDVYLPNPGNVGIGTSSTKTSALTVMNGNVGIGTWAPQYLFQVNGNIGIGTINSSNTNAIIVPNATSAAYNNMALYVGSKSSVFLGASGSATETGLNNTAVGEGDLLNLTSGGANTAFGFGALANATTGSANTALGDDALFYLAGNFSENTAIGSGAGECRTTNCTHLTQATEATFIGIDSFAGANTDTNEMVIGNAIGNNSNTITLGISTSGGTRDTIIPFGNMGIGTSLTANALDVSTAGVSIGTAYAGYITAPTNGLLVKGNVGIGSAAPGQALDVTGTVRTTNFTMSGQSPISGYVLTASTGSGNATWSVAGPALNSGWTISGNDVYETDNGNVGIGTTLVTTAALTVMNGNVGIGTWVPASPFSVMGDSYHNGNIGIGTTTVGAVGAKIVSLTVTRGDVGIGTWVPAYSLDVRGSVHAISYRDSGQNYFGAGPPNMETNSIRDLTQTTRISLINTGNVGIGTTTPGSKFTVLGGVGIGTSSYATDYAQFNGLVVQNNVGIGTFNPFGGSLIVNGGNNVGIGSLTPGQLLDVQGAVRDTGNITNGNVGIGTSFINGSGEAALTVMNGNVGIGTWVVTNGSIQGPHNASAVGQVLCWGTNDCLGYCTAGTYPACSACTCF